MRYPVSAMMLSFLIAICGCAEEGQSPATSYSGKAEVIRNGKTVACRTYAYKLDELPVGPNRLPKSFQLVQEGSEVAVFRVYWPTNAFEPARRQIEKLAEDRRKKMGEKVRVRSSVAVTKTSDYRLIKNDGRYSLCNRGSDDAEHFGFYAENDNDAMDVAMEYVIRFVVPLTHGEYLYEAKRLGVELPPEESK